GYEIISYPAYDTVQVLEVRSEPFRWSSSGGMVALESPESSNLGAEANAISADGTVIVGAGLNDLGAEGVVWTEDGALGVGDLVGGELYCRLSDVNADGTIAVGFGDTDEGNVAAVWTPDLGLRNFEELADLARILPEGWRLTNATGISSDGDVIVGNGINPDGNPEGWRISGASAMLQIPEPPPEGFQASLSVFHGEVVKFTAERENEYYLFSNGSSSSWSMLDEPFETQLAGSSLTYAFPVPSGAEDTSLRIGTSLDPAEADTEFERVEANLIGFTSERGFVYSLEYSDDMSHWNPLGDPIETHSDLGSMQRVFIDETAASDHLTRMYRIRIAESDVLGVPFDATEGTFIRFPADPGVFYQPQGRNSTSEEWADYGEALTMPNAATSGALYFAGTIGNPYFTYRVVLVPGEEPIASDLPSLVYGVRLDFETEPGYLYYPQRSTDGENYTLIVDDVRSQQYPVEFPIDTTDDTGIGQRTVVDALDPDDPPEEMFYRIVVVPAS
ncbi:MAG: hypothetical protein ACQKBU_03160, partial [Verrucomicrobiales bacterium]